MCVAERTCSNIYGLCRFGVVVEQLKSREADDIEDSKIASLTEALAQSATVTAVDLSRNNITASGAQVCARTSS